MDGSPRPAARPAVGFAAINLGYFAIILDGSVLNVAVPAIRADLHSSLAGAQWVLNSYTLALAGLLLTGGALGDRIGLRRTFLAGLAVFTLASVACAAAPGVPVLVAARTVQGIGAAALLPATLALIPHLFPDRADQARAAVVWVATGAGSVAVGPLVGGLLIDAFGWRAIFLINLPVGLAAAVLGRIGVTETPRQRRPVDRLGQPIAVVALVLLIGGIIRGGQSGWTAPLTLALLAAGLLGGAAFVLVQRVVRYPMLPPDFFADRLRTIAVACAAMMGFLFYGTLFVLSLYFQEGRGWTPGRTGVALLPLTVASTIGPFLLYRPLARRFGHPPLLVAGFGCAAAGVAVFLLTGPAAPYPLTALGLLLIGGASTISFSALTSLLVEHTPPGRAGLASGVQNTTRQSGALLSVSVLGALLNATALAPRLPYAYAVLAAVVLIALATSAQALRHRPAPA